MKVYRYIFFKALLSVLGVTLIISLIDISFNFFSQIEDISSSYSFRDALVFVFMSQPFRTREFLYLCIVVGLLATFIDQRFLRSINVLRQAGLKKFNLALLLFFPLALINFSTFEFLVPDLTKDAFEFRKSKVESSSKEPPTVIEIKGDIQNGFQIISEKVHVKFSTDGSVENDSQETKDELVEITRYQEARTKEDENSIAISDMVESYHFREYLDANKLDYKSSEITAIVDDVWKVTRTHKNKYNRPRPYQVAKALNMDFDTMYGESMATPSYPSGHSCGTRLIAEYLSQKHPAHRKQFVAIAERIGLGRLQAGFHYRSDHEAGKELAIKVFPYLEISKQDLLESIIDLPRRDYSRTVFDNYNTEKPVLKPFVKKMIEDQIRKRGIKNETVLKAMSSVRRELFVPENLQKIQKEIANKNPKCFLGKL